MKYNVRSRYRPAGWPGKCKYCPNPAGFGRIVCRECAWKKIQAKKKEDETKR